MKRQKQILFTLNLSGAVICLTLFLYLITKQNLFPEWYIALASVAYVANVWLLYKGHVYTAIISSIIVSVILLFLFDTGVRRDVLGIYVYYFPLLLFSYTVTRHEQFAERVFLFSLILSCILLVNFTNLSPQLSLFLYAEETAYILRGANVALALAISMFVVRMVINTNAKMERQLRDAKDAAEWASNEKTRFLSIMSHEVRTPANAIVGISYLLREKEIPADIKRDINVLHYSAQNLKAIIDNILYFNKLDAKEVIIESRPFDIRKFCRNAVDSFVLEAAKKNIELHFDFDDRIPQYLSGDHEKLAQVMNNLLSNAIKFTGKGHIHFWVKMNYMDDKSCFLMFKFADTGIGIAEERIPEVFNVFNQLNSKITRRHDGMGLGLSISRQLLELMGSNLKVDSKEGEGSNFYFEVKLDMTNEEKDEEQKFVETHDLGGKRILLVEDNKLNVLVAKKILNAMHAKVDVAKDGAEALRMHTDREYDLLLMDLHMPVMDGFEATRIIRMQDKKTPIVAFSADAFADARRKATEAGMNDFISKPFDPGMLYEKIKENLVA